MWTAFDWLVRGIFMLTWHGMVMCMPDAQLSAQIFKMTSHQHNLYLYCKQAAEVLQFDQYGSNSTLGEAAMSPTDERQILSRL